MFLRGQLLICQPAKAISRLHCMVNQRLFPHFLRKFSIGMTASQVKPVFLAVEKFIRKVISSQIPPCKEVTAEYYQKVGSLSQGVGEQFASHMQLRISCHKRLYSGFSRNCQSVSQQLAELRSSTESNILNCNVFFC